jgi:hypothetical protein
MNCSPIKMGVQVSLLYPYERVNNNEIHLVRRPHNKTHRRLLNNTGIGEKGEEEYWRGLTDLSTVCLQVKYPGKISTEK